MSQIPRKVQEIVDEVVDTVRLAVPGPKEIAHEIAHEMEHAAEFLDPRRSDVRYIAPELDFAETEEVLVTDEHERRPHGNEIPPENQQPQHL